MGSLDLDEKSMTWEISAMRRKTTFDLYLEERLKDNGFAQQFLKAGEVWDAVIKNSDRAKERNDRMPVIESAVE
jgi:hypothetical protein